LADRRLILKGAAALPPRELGNEPHTTDGYEQNRGIAPGKLVCDWVKEMAPYFKSLAPLQMITTGEHLLQKRCLHLESARDAAPDRLHHGAPLPVVLQSKVQLYVERYHLVLQRVKRNPLFRPTQFASLASGGGSECEVRRHAGCPRAAASFLLRLLPICCPGGTPTCKTPGEPGARGGAAWLHASGRPLPHPCNTSLSSPGRRRHPHNPPHTPPPPSRLAS
jgi:hypothetical protein